MGTVSLHLVSLWYPAGEAADRPAPYMTDEEAAAMLKGQKVTDVPSKAVSGIMTHSVTGARPAGRNGTLPLVVFSPGFTMTRSSLTGLAEELASRGYVVVGVDHVHESYGTTLPGGRLAACAACPEQEADARAFSLGGSSTSWTMVKDSRVRAGVDMDGTFFVPLPGEGLSRPFILMGAGEVHDPGRRPRLVHRLHGADQAIGQRSGDHAGVRGRLHGPAPARPRPASPGRSLRRLSRDQVLEMTRRTSRSWRRPGRAHRDVRRRAVGGSARSWRLLLPTRLPGLRRSLGSSKFALV
ncbi:hypothetical protein ACIBQ6_12600 [Nonomuraea sp. NPDC049655]|uniref:alpha/beta hydrolase n=1 Tax=Nonomuraea sp. NPDC049655 TaxID=3364355 RepID=UPI0037B1DEAD